MGTQEVVVNELPMPKVIDAKLAEFDRLLESNGQTGKDGTKALAATVG